MPLPTFVDAQRILRYHQSMLSDEPRLEAYGRALREVVRKGDVVLDLGAGTGVLAFLACQAGASRVYGIEHGYAIEVARELARHNGVADRITFIQGLSTEIELPETVDVVVTETLWNFGLGEGILASIVDARERFLRPGGTLMPRWIELVSAPVEHADLYEAKLETWQRTLDGIDLSPLRSLASNTVHIAEFRPQQLLGEPAVLTRVDLRSFSGMDVQAAASTALGRGGTIHGLAGWFRAGLSHTVVLSNEPPAPPSWSHAFLPLETPIGVGPGGVVEMTVDTIGNGAHWRWGITYREPGGDVTRSKSQTTLAGLPLSAERLARQAAEYAPRTVPRGEAALFVLRSLDGHTSIGELEGAVFDRYRALFRTRSEAGTFVRDLLNRSAE
jgi:protein arginine N-methyltransferase 1